MTNALFKFSFSGLIGWLDGMFFLYILFGASIQFRNHLFHESLATFGVSLAFLFASVVSFSAAGQIRQFRFINLMLVVSALINVVLGLLVAFGTDSNALFYLFLLIGIGNLGATLQPKRSIPAA